MSHTKHFRRYIPREKILRRDGYICAYCFENQGTQVDHILPVAYKDNPKEDNLIACCKRCNQIAGSMVFDSLQAKREYIQGVISRSHKWQQRLEPYIPIDVATKERKKFEVTVAAESDRRKHPKVNDKPHGAKDLFSQTVIRESLKSIIEHYGYQPDDIHVDDLQEIANTLSGLVDKKPPWGWAYLRNIINAKLDASAKMASAISKLGAIIDDVPAAWIMGEPVEVRALGKIHPGAIVYGDSKKCENFACSIHFVPRTWNQKFCSVECRRCQRILKTDSTD